MALKVDQSLEDYADYLGLALGDKLDNTSYTFGELTIEIAPENLLNILRFLRDDSQSQFVNLTDICGVDWPGRVRRFDVVYHLLSPKQNMRIRIKLQAGEETLVPSAVGVFPGADWFEREAYDMYGILFSGHPDLRRLLTDYGFQGHPLRKDFPTTGFVEVRYDEAVKRVVYEPVKLAQEFRQFDFESPWEGTEYELPGDEKASG